MINYKFIDVVPERREHINYVTQIEFNVRYVVLKDETNINIRQHRYPEFHKKEISNEVKEILTQKILINRTHHFNLTTWVGLEKTR